MDHLAVLIKRTRGILTAVGSIALGIAGIKTGGTAGWFFGVVFVGVAIALVAIAFRART